MKHTIIWFLTIVIALMIGMPNSVASQADKDSNQLYVTVMGYKNNSDAKLHYDAAVKYAPKDADIVWTDKKTENYPMLDKPAAYVCVKLRCSLPSFTPTQLKKTIQHFTVHVEKHTQNQMSDLLATRNIWIILPLFWFFGLLLSITPCVLPLMLIITSILGGSAETLSKSKAFTLSLTYIIALAFTYSIAGIIVAKLGFYLQGYMQNAWILICFSLFFIFLALSMLGFYRLQLPLKIRKSIANYGKARSSGSYIGVAIMGVLATLIASPCVAAPLAGILGYIAKSGDAYLGAIALFATGIGIGTPIIIISTVGIGMLQRAGEWQAYIKQFFGILLFAIAIWLLQRVTLGTIGMLLWAGLAIFTAIYMGVLKNQSEVIAGSVDPHKPLHAFIAAVSKMISLMLLIFGGALVVGALKGNTNPLKPLKSIQIHSSNTTNTLITKSSFLHVKNMTEFNHANTIAHKMNKPIFLMFSAAWCKSCKEIENDVIPDSRVQELLQKFVLLTVDLTNHKNEDYSLAKHFIVVGPPVIMFFYNSNERENARIDGYVNADTLTNLMIDVLQK